MNGCDIVFHLAALIAIPYSYVAPASYIDTNITGTLNVVQAARDLGVSRVIHTSTSETYGTAHMSLLTKIILLLVNLHMQQVKLELTNWPLVIGEVFKRL